MVNPIYFRVINDDITIYDLPDVTSKKIGKLKRGKIYVSYRKEKDFYKIDSDNYCTASPNYTVTIPVKDIIELNGEYAVKDDAEVEGMSRHKRVNVMDKIAKLVIFLIVTFMAMVLYTMAYCWINPTDSSPLNTLLQGYIALLTIILGLYVWSKKENKLLNSKKILQKLNMPQDDIDSRIEEHHNEDIS